MILINNPRLLSHSCKLIFSLGNLRIKFTAKNKLVTIHTQSTGKSEWRFILSTFLVFIYTIQCLMKRTNTLIDSVLAWNSLLMLYVSQAYIHQLRIKSHEIAFMINSLYHLDSLHPDHSGKESHSKVIKAKIVCAYILNLTAILMPIGFIHGPHWVNPCRTTLIGYWLLRRCYSHMQTTATTCEVFTDYLTHFGVILVNHWLWSFSIHAAAFGTAVIHTLCVTTLQQIIES